MRFIQFLFYYWKIVVSKMERTESGSSETDRNEYWDVWNDRVERAVMQTDFFRYRQTSFDFSPVVRPIRGRGAYSAPTVPPGRGHSAPVSPRGPPLPDPEPWCGYCRRRYEGNPRKWQNHKDVDWKSGEYRCQILIRKVNEKRNELPLHCSYCSKAAPEIADSHWKRCPITKKITCPMLRSLPPCQKCGAYGDKAHTTGACPERPHLEYPSPPDTAASAGHE